MTPTGAHWCPLVSIGAHWSPRVVMSPLVSTGTHWCPLVPTGVRWSPQVSTGASHLEFTRAQWKPIEAVGGH
eukprot:10050128-Lingulodinium_polyedra.AAC.1